MGQEQGCLRVGAAAIGCALLLRLVSGGALVPAVGFFGQSQVASFLLYLETGRIMRPAQTLELPQPTVPRQTQPPEPTVPEETSAQTELPRVSFSAKDAELVHLQNYTGYQPDIGTMLEQPLDWDLTRDGPAVLILHTHTTESYEPNGEDYAESSAYRTLDEGYNVISIGDEIARVLEDGGIQVIHDRTFHDYPSYNGSYGRSRTTIRKYLEQYPSIRLVLDIHRDAASIGSGRQLKTGCTVDGKASSQLMLVVGTDVNLDHPDWETNMALAAKLHVLLEKTHPGICRPVSFRKERFNQDMGSGALLIEVGAAGDTRQEALVAAGALGQGILALAHGTATADSTR